MKEFEEIKIKSATKILLEAKKISNEAFCELCEMFRNNKNNNQRIKQA